MFTTEVSNAIVGVFNDSNVSFTDKSNTVLVCIHSETKPDSLQADGLQHLTLGQPEDLAAGWGPVTVGVATGTSGFENLNDHLNNTDTANSFGGWRICQFCPMTYVRLIIS